MIEKVIVTGLISILENGVLQIREDTVILEDGIELSRTYHREILTPGSDVSDESERVQQVAAIVWTPEVIAAWEIEKAKLPTIPNSTEMKK
jgi:hypothetical protein